MPAPLHQDATAYLKQQGIPITTNSLNRTMNLLQQEPNLRPSYSGQGAMDVDIETMRPVNQKIEGHSLPPLQTQSNTNQSFGQAFKVARKQLGAGKTFDWNGKKYTTDYKEEVSKRPSSPQQSSGDDIAEGDPINTEDETEMLDDLNAEKMDNVDGSSAPPVRNRGNYSEINEANDGMDNLLTALLGGGAVAGGAALLGKSGQQKPPRQMSRGDLYVPQSDNTGQMTDEDLYGKKPQQMVEGDLSFSDKQLNAMTDADLYGKPATDADYLDEVLKGVDWVDDEKQAAKMLKAGNKQGAKKLLPKLQGIGADPKLISIIKGLM